MKMIKQKNDLSGHSKISMVIIAIMLLLFGYITDYPERPAEKVQYDAAYAEAAEFASGYIVGKYGFEARTVENEETDILNKYNNSAKTVSCIGCIEKPEDRRFTFDMEANGREFTVNVYISPEETFADDNYQYEEIKAAAMSELETEISRSLPGGNILRFSMKAYFSEYFDGGSIDEFLEKSRGYGYIEMIFANADFSAPAAMETLDMLTKKYSFDITFTSFDTRERTEDFINYLDSDESSFFRGLYGYYKYEIFAPYITDFICTSDGKRIMADVYKVRSCGEFDCCIFPSDGEITEAAADGITDLFKEYDEEYCLERPLSKAYRVNKKKCGRMYILSA